MLKIRYVQCMLSFFIFFTGFLMRLNLPVAIVAMTNRTSANPNFEELQWDLNIKSKVLSGFSWGFLIIQIPAGQIGQLISVKQLLLGVHSLCAVLALLTPLSAIHGDWLALFVIRICQGLCQGFYMPLIYNLASKWAPPKERNRFVGYAINGITFGAAVAVSGSGFLASSNWGWPSVFYLSGALSLTCSAVWWWLGADSPLKHPTIKPAERDYLQIELAHSSHDKSYPTPWRSIFTSVPVMALSAAHMASGWGSSIIINQVPTYLNDVLGFNIQTNGFVSALTYISPFIFTFPICWLADMTIKRHILSLNVVRKGSTTICLGVYAITIASIYLVDHNTTITVIILTTATTLATFMLCGFFINHLDLSPNFAGVLVGLTNMLENVTAILATLSVGWMVPHPTSAEEWKMVFLTQAMVSVLGNVIFVIFGSAELQHWNSPKEENTVIDNNTDIKIHI